MTDMDIIESLWKKYNDYKETAGQHEFFQLFMLDSKLIPLYNDLQENYDKEHANLFIKIMNEVLGSLGFMTTSVN